MKLFCRIYESLSLLLGLLSHRAGREGCTRWKLLTTQFSLLGCLVNISIFLEIPCGISERGREEFLCWCWNKILIFEKLEERSWREMLLVCTFPSLEKWADGFRWQSCWVLWGRAGPWVVKGVGTRVRLGEKQRQKKLILNRETEVHRFSSSWDEHSTPYTIKGWESRNVTGRQAGEHNG